MDRRFDRRPQLLGAGEIHFVQNDQLRLLAQVWIKQFQLLIDRIKVTQRIGAVAAQQVDENPCALDMAQEIKAQPDPFMGAFHQPGDVNE